MTGEEEVQEERTRELLLLWVTRAESLLDSAALLETTRPRGWIDPEERESLRQRCERLAQPWGPKFSKAVLLLGLAEADGRRAHDAFHHLAVIIELADSVIAGATSVDVEEARDDCRAALAKLSKLVAVAEDESRRNIWPQTRQGRPSAERISLEFLAERAKAGKTLQILEPRRRRLPQRSRNGSTGSTSTSQRRRRGPSRIISARNSMP